MERCRLGITDEFELYRARANSGGNLYGMVPCHEPAAPPPPQPLVCGSDDITDNGLEMNVNLLRRTKSLTPAMTAEMKRKNLARASRERAASGQTPVTSSGGGAGGGSEGAGDRGRGGRRRHSTPSISSYQSSCWLKPPGPVVKDALPEFDSSSKLNGEDGGEQQQPEVHLHRRRSFTTTSKGGLVNEGDLPISEEEGEWLIESRSRASSFNSHISDTSDREASVASLTASDNNAYRVLVLGGSSVGKTALTQQFMTSEYMAAQNTSFDDTVECLVPVLLNGEESILEFLDVPCTGNTTFWQDYNVDAYVIIFSTNDRRSYKKAVDLLFDIRRNRGDRVALILVANKCDLVRTRIVGEQEGKSVAETYGAKYLEVSAVLNHKVDDLLVLILKQIVTCRQKMTSPVNNGSCSNNSTTVCPRQDSTDTTATTTTTSSTSSCFSPKSPYSLLGSLFRPSRSYSKSCEHLLIH